MDLLVGGDPEFFLKDKNTGEFVSVTDFKVPGTKEQPYKVKGGAVQKDGTALEVNIDPASTSKEFCTNLKTVITEAQGLLPDHVALEFVPTVHYKEDYFKKIPKKALELGCNPDYQSTNGGWANAPPKPIGTMRTGSGHIALGWGDSYDVQDATHFNDCCQMAQRLNLFYEPFVKFWDYDTERHNLYGYGGAFRPKPFGVEFRSLSNAWVGQEKLWPWIFESAKWVFNHALEGGEIDTKRYVSYNHAHQQEYLGYNYDKEQHCHHHYGIPGYNMKLSDRKKAVEDYIFNKFGKKDFPPLPEDFVPPPALEAPKNLQGALKAAYLSTYTTNTYKIFYQGGV